MEDRETRRRRLADARLYLCTDARTEQHDLAEFAHAALAGGVDIVQLRHKPGGVPLDPVDELAALEVLRDACDRHGALLAVNDRADIALAANADILHLGQDDLPLEWARRVLGTGVLLGQSTHDGWQMRAALTHEDTDYFCVGPCWPTPTKPGRPAPGTGLVRSTAMLGPAVQHMPWFAIGGIDLERLDEVVTAGARRVVVVRAITEADDPEAAARAFATRLRALDGP